MNGMEDGRGKSTAIAQQQQQQQQQLMQQQLLLQQIQRQKDAISRFPSNIDAHLRPHHHPIPHHHRPLNPNSPIIPNNPNPSNNPNPAPNSSTSNPPPQQMQMQQQHKASLQLAYQDAWRVCHPDFKRPFSSLEDACERLLPYHVVADYEAEEDDKILDSANNTTTTGNQVLSRSQQWDHNIAAKVSEFTATFEKQVLAFNIISRKRGLGEFRTEEKLMMEQLLLQEEKRSLLELRAEMDSRQKANRETQEAHMRMAAMEKARLESQAHAEMLARAPIRASALGSRANNNNNNNNNNMIGSDDVMDFQPDDIINGWGGNMHRGDDKDEPSDDFLNDDEAENGDDGTLQSEWHGAGELDLNVR